LAGETSVLIDPEAQLFDVRPGGEACIEGVKPSESANKPTGAAVRRNDGLVTEDLIVRKRDAFKRQEFLAE
jgi:hypothetical protein